MPASTQDIERLRRMVAEPTQDPYTDAVLQAVLDEHPLLDIDGLRPADEGWMPTYDLNASAADVWAEKASALASAYDFTSDGASFQRSQQILQAQSMERKYRARRVARSAAIVAI